MVLAVITIFAANRQEQLADNLAALVAALDRSFVPEIDAISDPLPESFRPEP
jgi:aryl-alcohol dehydrogenase-like predicted oxidoreductase